MTDNAYDEDNATVILITFALDTINELKPGQLTPYHSKVIIAAKSLWKAEVCRTLENLERNKEKIKNVNQDGMLEILLTNTEETIKMLKGGIEEIDQCPLFHDQSLDNKCMFNFEE